MHMYRVCVAAVMREGRGYRWGVLGADRGVLCASSATYDRSLLGVVAPVVNLRAPQCDRGGSQVARALLSTKMCGFSARR